MTLLHAASVQRWLRGHLLCHVADAGPRFALTFDDGPSPRNTPRLLEVLARHGARATFFVMRSRLRSHAELGRRLLAEGHEIGVHGDWHLPPWALPPRWLRAEIARSVAAARDTLNITPRHYRAPFGLLLPHQARTVRSQGLVPVLGDVYPRDHSFRNAEPIVQCVLGRLQEGSIVILHDSSAAFDGDRSATIAAVGTILETTARRGLSAVTLREMATS